MSVLVRGGAGRSRNIARARVSAAKRPSTDLWWTYARVSLSMTTGITVFNLVVYREETTLLYNLFDNRNPAWQPFGTVALNIVDRNTITATYNGMIISADISATPMHSYERWYPFVTIIQSNDAANPFTAVDNFVCDGFSDDFNRASGTLFSDPSTDWVQGNGILDISSQQVQEFSVPSGDFNSMYWDALTDNRDVTHQLDIASLRLPSPPNEGWHIRTGLISYPQDAIPITPGYGWAVIL